MYLYNKTQSQIQIAETKTITLYNYLEISFYSLAFLNFNSLKTLFQLITKIIKAYIH